MNEIEVKALCFDLQKQNADLMNYLAAIAKLVGAVDINDIHPKVAKLVADIKEVEERRERLKVVEEFISE